MKKLIICAIIAMASISAFAQNKGFEKTVEATGGIGYDYEAFDTTLGSSGYEMHHVLAGKFAIHLGFRF